MKTLLYLVLLLAACSVASAQTYDIRDAPYLFHKFIRDYDRRYKDTEEVVFRYASFVETLNDINKLNELSKTATFDINEFADYYNDEIQNMMGFKPKGPRRPAPPAGTLSAKLLNFR